MAFRRSCGVCKIKTLGFLVQVDFEPVMGDKPVWLEGASQKTFFFAQIKHQFGL
jgi:hypothetical protein